MEAERYDESYASLCHFLLKHLQLAGRHTTCYLKSEKQCRYTGETNTKVIRIAKDIKVERKKRTGSNQFSPSAVSQVRGLPEDCIAELNQ